MSRKLKMLMASRPDEPWLWREDWAQGQSRPQTSQAKLMFFMGTMFLLISSPGLFFLPEEMAKENYPALLLLIFPLVGLGLLTWAFRLTFGSRSYGAPSLPLTSVPVPLGARFQSSLRLTKSLAPGSEVKMNFACLHITVSGSGKNRTRRENVLWNSFKTIKASGREFPIEFDVPFDQKETDIRMPDDSIIWKLEIESSQPGTDLLLNYELPVFKTAQSNSAWTASAVPDMQAQVKGFDPAHARDFKLLPGPGGTVITQRPYRYPGVCLIGLFGGLLFLSAGIGIFVATYEGSIMATSTIFLLAFGGVGSIIFLSALTGLLQKRELSLGPRGIVVKITLLGTRTIRIPWEDIHEFETRNSMASGRRVWKDIRARLVGRRSKTLLTLLEDPTEIQWLLQLLQSSYPK